MSVHCKLTKYCILTFQETFSPYIVKLIIWYLVRRKQEIIETKLEKKNKIQKIDDFKREWKLP